MYTLMNQGVPLAVIHPCELIGNDVRVIRPAILETLTSIMSLLNCEETGVDSPLLRVCISSCVVHGSDFCWFSVDPVVLVDLRFIVVDSLGSVASAPLGSVAPDRWLAYI